MEFRVLGPVEVWSAGHRLPPFARKPASLLTAGLVDAGKVVPIDRLVDAVWGDDPPTTAAKLVQSYVARLRHVLHRPGILDVIVTRPRGYVFRPEEGQLDLERFQVLLERGRAEAASGDCETAADTLSDGLALWRGPALGGPTTPLLRMEATRLEEMRLAAVEVMLGARVEAGHADEMVGDLIRLVSEFPLRERVRGLLMTALDHCGRRADALRVYREGYRQLRSELGIEPGHELRELHDRMLHAQAPVELPGARPDQYQRREPPHGPRTPAQLPAPPYRFTARHIEVDLLVAALCDEAGTGRVCVVTGMTGVGKTALALHVAHLLLSEFPDGQLFADLRGGDPSRAAEPGEVLGEFLRALGVRPELVPMSLAERSSAYRTILAQRRLLVVLDDAAGEHQVRPLLPGGRGGSGAIVTSGRGLPCLDAAARTDLDVLNAAHTLELLACLAGPGRMAADPVSAAEMARLSGGLPLAVRIMGSRLGARSRWPLRTLADRLRDKDTRLDELNSGDLDVRAGIEVCYRALPEPERCAFRRLGLLETPDFAPWIATPLLAARSPLAQQLVERLAEAHLLDSLGADAAGQVRYRFHELVGLYAREQARNEESDNDRSEAVARLLRTVLTLLCRADVATASPHIVLGPGPTAEEPDPTLVSVLLNRPQAWLAAEHATLTATVRIAACYGLHEQARRLTSALVRATARYGTTRTARHTQPKPQPCADTCVARPGRPGRIEGSAGCGHRPG